MNWPAPASWASRPNDSSTLCSPCPATWPPWCASSATGTRLSQGVCICCSLSLESSSPAQLYSFLPQAHPQLHLWVELSSSLLLETAFLYPPPHTHLGPLQPPLPCFVSQHCIYHHLTYRVIYLLVWAVCLVLPEYKLGESREISFVPWDAGLGARYSTHMCWIRLKAESLQAWPVPVLLMRGQWPDISHTRCCRLGGRGLEEASPGATGSSFLNQCHAKVPEWVLFPGTCWGDADTTHLDATIQGSPSGLSISRCGPGWRGHLRPRR